MMTPEPQKDVLEEVLRLLARAKPEQTKRLLDHIANLPAGKGVHYDA